MRKLYTLKWPSASAPLCLRTPAYCLRRTHSVYFVYRTQISRSPAQSVLGSGMGSLSDLLIAFQVNDSELFVRLFLLSKGAYNLQSSNHFPLWTAETPFSLSLSFCLFISHSPFCSVLFICFVLVSTFSVTAAFYADYKSPLLPFRSPFHKYASSGNRPAQVSGEGGEEGGSKTFAVHVNNLMR